MQRLGRFLRRYKLFSFAIISALVGLGLLLLEQKTAAHWLISVVAILEALPLLAAMWQDVRAGSYGIDILAITAIIASMLLGQYWAAIVVVLMLTGGQSLEDYAEHRSRVELDALLRHAPQTAHVIRGRKTLELKANEIHVGDKLIIKPGELVPADAIIIEGSSSFDESSLTGESLPQQKSLNDQVLSGAVNIEGLITAKASAIAADSQYQQIIKLVRSAAASRAPFVRLAERYSIPFSLTAFAIAGAVWVISGHAIRFLEVIIVATPCPLLLAAPIALVSGMSRASKYGIVVRTGSALEKLAEAETIAFDKTGTLTSGQLSVDTVTAFGTFSKDDVIAIAASLEQNSNHVLAQAITNYADAQKVRFVKAKRVQELSGLGVQAIIKGKSVLVGRDALLTSEGLSLSAAQAKVAAHQTATYVAIGDQVAGVITLTDSLRPETKKTLASLRKFGLKKILMITGDSQAAATSIAKSLSISDVYAEMMPGDKLHTLEKIKDRPLVFVGDGVNDAPSLTAADVGIALGARGSTAASESADMIILSDDLGRVATAFSLAKQTFKIARQSILVGIGLSLLLMLVFATGKFPPLLGALLQEVVDVVVIFNALRAHAIKA